ncbi:hypothetical protein AR687_22510 [Flavobacteriaceae bacterium CRH]|nr:hypothetical protein AR687_22510 [Flavobacteriaceae bacterium CRH]
MKTSRKKIINSAIHILNKDEWATVEQIAAHAGVTRRTIHRYFNDRNDLIENCKKEMLTICNTAMTGSYNSSEEPIIKLENMLYAAIEVGSQYSFLKKIYMRSNYGEIQNNIEQEYDNVKWRWYKLVEEMQSSSLINKELTIPWIYNLFGGIIDIAVNALESGDVASNDIKKFAWISFQGSIGLTKKNS